MSAMLTADWCLLGRDVYFRKFEVYSMAWYSDVNLENVMISVAPNGGPVALVRDPSKFVQIHGGGKPVISIYSQSGIQISSVVWSSGTIIALGWSDAEQLICVQEDGMVLYYDLYGNYQHTFSMGQEARDSKIIDAKIFYTKNGTTGIAVLTTKFKIFLVNNMKEPKIRELSSVTSQIPQSALFGHLIWPVLCEKRDTEVLFFLAGHNSLYRLSQSDCLARVSPASQGKIIDAALTSNNPNESTSTSLALFTDAGILWMGTVDLKTTYCEVDLKKRTAPKQMLWCGTDAVVCYWPGLLVIVSATDGETASYYYDNVLYLVQEIDCIRILSGHQHEILQKVPTVVQMVLRINSTDPGSYLLEASKHYQKRSHRSDEYIGLVKDVRLAVTQCIEAAGFEFDINTQKMLMRAAQFGKCFIPGIDLDKYVRMCRELRVLNAVRDSRIGIPITYVQMHLQKYHNLLDRLVARRYYYLAIQIAKYLRMPEEQGASRILVHWASYKVMQTQLPWDEVAQEIANKLGLTPGVSYSDIARKAVEFGRKQLAIKLLEYEPQARKQVPLLLQLQEDKQALKNAIESGDTELVYTVLFHMQANNPLADFQMTVRNFPMAQALYQKHCREHNPQALIDIFHQEDDFNSKAAEYIRHSFERKNAQNRESFLTDAYDAYKSARNDLSASFCDESLKLLKHQKQFEDKFPDHKFYGKSVHDTLYILLSINEIKLADKLKSEYKVPDRRYWWLRINTLAEQRKWIELDKFAKSKKSPIGYEPFVDVSLKYEKSEALNYLPKVREELKVKYYVKAGKFEEAAQIAFEQKDLQNLLAIQGKCPSRSTASEKIEKYISLLRK